MAQTNDYTETEITKSLQRQRMVLMQTKADADSTKSTLLFNSCERYVLEEAKPGG